MTVCACVLGGGQGGTRSIYDGRGGGGGGSDGASYCKPKKIHKLKF